MLFRSAGMAAPSPRPRRRGAVQTAQALLAAMPGALAPAESHAAPPTIPAPEGAAQPERPIDAPPALDRPQPRPADGPDLGPAVAIAVALGHHRAGPTPARAWARPTPTARVA